MQNLSRVNVVVTNITIEPFFGIYLKDFFEKEELNVKLNSISFNGRSLNTNYNNKQCLKYQNRITRRILWNT